MRHGVAAAVEVPTAGRSFVAHVGTTNAKIVQVVEIVPTIRQLSLTPPVLHHEDVTLADNDCFSIVFQSILLVSDYTALAVVLRYDELLTLRFKLYNRTLSFENTRLSTIAFWAICSRSSSGEIISQLLLAYLLAHRSFIRSNTHSLT